MNDEEAEYAKMSNISHELLLAKEKTLQIQIENDTMRIVEQTKQMELKVRCLEAGLTI